MKRQPQRLGLLAAGELMFAAPIGLAYLQIVGAGGRERAALTPLLVLVLGTNWAVKVCAAWLLQRPVHRFVAASGRGDDELVRRAAKAAVALPLRLACVWGGTWLAAFMAIICVSDHTVTPALALFLTAVSVGPFCATHALAAWSMTDARRALDAAAAERKLVANLPTVPLRGKLMMYALGIAITASTFIAAVGLGARAHGTSQGELALTMCLGFAVVAAFALVCARLLGDSLAQPVLDLAEAVGAIARRGSARQIGRIARPEQDEIGVLVERTNEMIVRLERSELEREAAVASLERMNRTLEERVRERTVRLVETGDELERETTQRFLVESELELATRIQASILPKRWHVEGLSISAAMVTAANVGGDYYDILPDAGGGWLAIGDVSGHGLGAGLIMLMLQSATASTVRGDPNAPARQHVVAINRVLSENIRRRMVLKDFVTFTLLRVELDGSVRYAGAHEDLIIWRQASGRCETLTTPGPWLGVVEDIAANTVEGTLQLEPGDLLVLYTDGITEARNGARVQFGMTRLCETIEAHAQASEQDIVDAVVAAVRAWSPSVEDDRTIVVARRRRADV